MPPPAVHRIGAVSERAHAGGEGLQALEEDPEQHQDHRGSVRAAADHTSVSASDRDRSHRVGQIGRPIVNSAPMSTSTIEIAIVSIFGERWSPGFQRIPPRTGSTSISRQQRADDQQRRPRDQQPVRKLAVEGQAEIHEDRDRHAADR